VPPAPPLQSFHRRRQCRTCCCETSARHFGWRTINFSPGNLYPQCLIAVIRSESSSCRHVSGPTALDKIGFWQTGNFPRQLLSAGLGSFPFVAAARPWSIAPDLDRLNEEKPACREPGLRRARRRNRPAAKRRAPLPPPCVAPLRPIPSSFSVARHPRSYHDESL